MSSYYRETKHPLTGEWERAMWIDDKFGPRHYGVVFPSDEVAYDPEKWDLETRIRDMTTPESKEKCCAECDATRKSLPIGTCAYAYDCPCHQRPESDWKEEFREARPDSFWMPDHLQVEQESPIKYFGYKWFDGKQIHEVTDWAHIEKFIARQRDREYQRGLAEGARAEQERISSELWYSPPSSIKNEFSNGVTLGWNNAIDYVQKLLTTPPHKSV